MIQINILAIITMIGSIFRSINIVKYFIGSGVGAFRNPVKPLTILPNIKSS